MAPFDLVAWCGHYYEKLLLGDMELLGIARELHGRPRIDQEELNSILCPYVPENAATTELGHRPGGIDSQRISSDLFGTNKEKSYERLIDELTSCLARGESSADAIERGGNYNFAEVSAKLEKLREEIYRRIATEFIRCGSLDEKDQVCALTDYQDGYQLSREHLENLQSLGTIDYEAWFRDRVNLCLKNALTDSQALQSNGETKLDSVVESLIEGILRGEITLGRQFDVFERLLHEKEEDRIHRKKIHQLPREAIEALRAAVEKVGLIRLESDGSFWINPEATTYLIAKEAFREVWKNLSSKHRPTWPRKGSHRYVPPKVLLDRSQEADSFSEHIDIIETMENSVIRRKVMGKRQVLSAEDLCEFEIHRNCGFKVLVAVDSSHSMKHHDHMKNAREACLALAYYVRRYHPSDQIEFVKFDCEVKEVDFNELPKMQYTEMGCTKTAEVLRYAVEHFARERKKEKVFLIITDGVPTPVFGCDEDEWLEYGRKTVETARAIAANRIHFIQVFLGNFDKDEENLQYSKRITRNIAEAGRGAFYHAMKSKNVPSLILENYMRLTER